MIMLNSNVIVPDIDKLSYKDWLQVRRSGIGGSDAAAALGLSPWKSALELWQEKVSGQRQPTQENEAMIWGRLMEPIITKEFVRRTGKNVTPMRSMLQAVNWPWMRADLDGIIEDPQRGTGIFESKTASAFKQDEWAEERCPDAYMLQLSHYMAITGLSYAVICVLIGGNKLHWITVDRDDELIASLVQLEQRFWQYVLTRTPPPIDGSVACTELLSRKYPLSSNAAPMILPVDADSWIRDYIRAKAEEEAATERKRLAENRIKEVMKDHEKGTSPSGGQAIWKTVQSTRIDSARLKKEEPALFEKFSTTSTTRRFSISEGK